MHIYSWIFIRCIISVISEIHPLLNVKKPNEKQHKKPTTKSKPKSGKSDRSKHRGIV